MWCFGIVLAVWKIIVFFFERELYAVIRRKKWVFVLFCLSCRSSRSILVRHIFELEVVCIAESSYDRLLYMLQTSYDELLLQRKRILNTGALMFIRKFQMSMWFLKIYIPFLLEDRYDIFVRLSSFFSYIYSEIATQRWNRTDK